MAKAPQPTNMAVQGNVMMYKNPQPLTKDAHQKAGVKRIKKPFEFMASTHFMPITAPEFGLAANSFPVIFAGEARTPLAVLGVRQNENLFVTNGEFDNDYYMPAFARRYPFVLAGDPESDRFIVCVDQDAECVTGKKPEQPFFEGDQTSKFTNEAFEFLQSFERDRRATQVMIERFKALDLFESKDMNFQGQNPDGSPSEKQKIADYFAITEERLRKLDAATVKEFNENGYMAVAHAHMISLTNWQRLVNRTLRRVEAENKAATKKKK